MRVRVLLTFFVLFLILSPNVQSCGVTTHNVIARRAMEWFSTLDVNYTQIIMNHQDAFQNGAAFPDWGYSCFLTDIEPVKYGDLPDASEGTHWPPFQNVTSKYIYEHYTQPWDEDAQKFVAFLLGVVSHQVADVIWHDLDYVGNYIHQGFIQTLANIDFNARGSGYSSHAHSVADTGGEMMCARYESLNWLRTEWYLPSGPLAEIFQAWGFTNVTSGVLEDCNAELYAEVHAIKYFGTLLYPWWAHDSEFLTEHYYDFFVGGINDNAYWTTQCWPYTIQWTETGVAQGICEVLSEWGWTPPNQITGLSDHLEREGAELQSRIDYESVFNYRINQRKKMKQLIEPYAEKFTVKTVKRTNSGVTFKITDNLPKKEQQEETDKPLIGFCKKGDESIVNQINFYVSTQNSRFGSAITMGDYNNDGFEDLVIGASNYPFENAPKSGAVWIIYGQEGFEFSGEQYVDLENYDTDQWTVSMLKPEAKASSGNGLFGSALMTVDFNADGVDDLVVSQSQAQGDKLIYNGKVYIYFGTETETGIQNGQQANITIYPPTLTNGTNMGSSLQRGDLNQDGIDDLFVGLPNIDGNEGQQVGALWVFLSSKSRSSVSVLNETDVDFALDGDDMYEWFGYSSVLAKIQQTNELYLFVGGPVYNHNNTAGLGKLFAFNVTDYKNPQVLFEIKGDNFFGKFGFAVDFGSPIASHFLLAVSTPTRQIDHSPQAGRVELLDISDLTGIHNISELSPFSIFESDEEFSRFGYQIKFANLDVSTSSAKVDDLIISHPYRNNNGTEGGRLYIFRGGALFPRGTVHFPEDRAEYCFKARDRYALFGSSFGLTTFLQPDSTVRNLVASLQTISLFKKTTDMQDGAVALIQLPTSS